MAWGPKTRIAAVFVFALLASCNSDDAFVGPGGGGGGGGPGDPVDPVAANIVLLADPPVLASNAINDENGVTITAIVRDTSNNVVPNVPLTFSADSGALTVLDNVTNENGRATATLTTGGDPQNRTTTVTVSAGEVESTITIDVTGTRISVSGATSLEAGETETYTVSLIHSGGAGIRDVTVQATSENGNTISPATAVTAVDGTAEFDVTGTAGGEDTLTFTGLGLSVSTDVLVSSYGITFSAPAANAEIAFGDSVTVNIVLRQDGTPLDGEEILFSTTRGTLSSFTQTTAGGGLASVTLTATGSDGAGPVIVTARGPEDVTRRLALEFVSTTPTAIEVQASPSTIAPEGTAAITAVVTDPDGNPVKGEAVRFSLSDLSGGQLLSSTDVTDSQGVARSTYQAGTASSALNGVEINADFGDPVISSDVATVTVAAPTVFMVLGTDNQIEKHDEDATYSKVFNALITDSAGNPASPDTVFRLTLRSLEYQKGFMALPAPPDTGDWVPVWLVSDTDPFFGMPNGSPPPTFGPYYGYGPFGCRSEDPLGTGNINLAAFGDYNNNGQIDPPSVASVPSTVEINEDGIASFRIRWPQNYALWVLVRLTATASVDGTESTRNLDFVLPIAVEDLNANAFPPNQVSPFGVAADCTNPT
ncbi:MAG: Ig-like domain-containing protein [Gammaproteobacteria bacterium]